MRGLDIGEMDGGCNDRLPLLNVSLFTRIAECKLSITDVWTWSLYASVECAFISIVRYTYDIDFLRSFLCLDLPLLEQVLANIDYDEYVTRKVIFACIALGSIELFHRARPPWTFKKDIPLQFIGINANFVR